MAHNENRARTGRAAAAAKRRPRRGAVAERQTPPLSISIDGLIKDGSDREFRRMIYSLVGFADMIVRHREYYGAYIGVSGPQYVMMTIIGGAERATVNSIAEQMNVSTQFITAEIGKLIKRNIVQKTPNEADRRSMFLSLTPKAQTLLHELGPLRRASNDIMYRSMTTARASTLQEILSELIVDAKRALHELDAPDMRGKKAPSAQSEAATESAGQPAARRRLASTTRR